MSKYVEFPLDGGGSITIESGEEPTRSGTGFLRGDETYTAANTATQSFDASVESVRKSADLLVSKLRSLSTPPDELTVAFALKASGELGGLAVAKNGGDANFNVTLKWSKDGQKNGQKDDDAPGEAASAAKPASKRATKAVGRPAPAAAPPPDVLEPDDPDADDDD